MSAYRSNVAAFDDEPARGQGEYINGGKLERQGGDCYCRVPGLLSRLWNRIEFGDKWHCTCGVSWTWRHWQHAAVRGTDNCWRNDKGVQRR